MISRDSFTPVAITKVAGQYPDVFPFNPDEAYPEYSGRNLSNEPNYVYRAVRESLRLLGCDTEKVGSKEWNPLGFLIEPGDRVFIKPNLLTHEYRNSFGHNGDIYSVITHPSIVRAVADYAAIALKGQGEIIIGDNPCIDADFNRLLEITQLHLFESFYRDNFGVNCRVLDLRPMRTDNLYYYGFKSKTKQLKGDPESSSIINLGEKSYFYGMNPLLFRGVYTKRWETIKHHHGKVHEYCISNTVLNSDVYISIPKLKTHHKVGVSLNIKGLVGINANKNFLIHWRLGFPKMGGDEFPPPHRLTDYFILALRHLFLDLIPEEKYLWLRQQLKGTKLDILFQDTKCLSFKHYRGAWDGNDTCWRMAADLYNVFVKDITGWRQRNGKNRGVKTFSVLDGVVAGEGEGPFCPTAKPAQFIIAGEDLLLVDCIGVRLMDFKLEEVKYIDHLIRDNQVNLNKVSLISEDLDTANFFDQNKNYLQFVPPVDWKNLTIGNHRGNKQ